MHMTGFEASQTFCRTDEVRRLTERTLCVLRGCVADLGECTEGCDIVKVPAVTPADIERHGLAAKKPACAAQNVVFHKAERAGNVVCRADGDIAHLRAMLKCHEPRYHLGKRAVTAEDEELVKLRCVLGRKLGRMGSVLREKQRHRAACIA